MSKIEVMFALLVDTMKDTVRLAPDIKFDKGKQVHRAIMALYVSIIENTDSAIVLHRAKRSAGLETILRTNLEAFVDLSNMCNDPAYYNQMLALYHKDSLDLMQHGLAGNPYLDFFKKDPEAAHTLEEHKTALAELQKLGPTLNIFDRFRLAGLENEYRAVYKDLCSHSHNNIKALSDKHFAGETEAEIEVVLFADIGKEALLACLDYYVTILSQAAFFVHDYFKSSSADEVKAFMKRRTDLEAFFAKDGD
ncbi:hypothetical protein BFX40_29680 [Mesorhizobium sp. SEMIA 3007]|uniref:DUF5677 domain-containing protein n=1 Tax=Mesorhizobium sp. SEMIA 3007 TaxID=1862350 RepID=UPI00083E1726|nr:DUF5677 domain-containing protein [Mesorhizobium sp. SEMIA 3007]ODA96602.1 hypothetical protein BFX40_29680 [Mesorhizobium sp. SEMIA 3007]